MEPNAIIYKYNKYIQVNGSLFYAFDYLLKVTEHQMMYPTENKTLLYIVIPTKFKRNYLLKLLHTLRTRYPIWYKTFFRDKKIFEIAKNNLSQDEYRELEFKIKVCIEAYSRIKLVTPLELLKKKFENVLLVSHSTWIDCYDKINAKNHLIIQNRRNLEIDNLEIPKTKYPTKVYYELDSQLGELARSFEVFKYSPKVALDYIIPKKIYKVYSKSEYIIAGEPIANTGLGLNHNNQFRKPSLFIQVPKMMQLEISGLQELSIFLNTSRIDYYQNFIRFDENSRIIIEARYLEIPIRIIKDATKNLKDIDNLQSSYYENLPEDSSVSRLVNPLKDYTLESNDEIVNQLK